MGQNSTVLLNCKDASFGYDGKAVISDLNFTVSKGDYVCIVGENGSGKSSLMKGILKLNTTLSGQIHFSDTVLHGAIGYLPQQTSHQRDFPASVNEIVLSGFSNTKGFRPFYNKAEKANANAIMDKLNVLEFKHKSYAELSGGQQQRVLLARALCAGDKMLLLDEPVAGLDPIAMQEFYALVKKLNSENKVTILMISHDINSVIAYASHILYVHKKQLFFGTTEKYLASKWGKHFLTEENNVEYSS